MKLTMEWLIENSACRDGKDWFAAQTETDAVTVCETLISHNSDWANWLIVRMLNRQNKIRYAVYAAEQVLGIYESKYPDNDSPRKAIEAAKKCIEDDSEENRLAASASADSAASASADSADYASAAAAAAAASADSAADSADYASAASAADSADYASAAAADAADSADYAADSAARKAAIIRNGIALFLDQEGGK